MTPPRPSWSDRAYGLLLRVAYPAWFRTRFGMAMRQTFDAEHLAARERRLNGVTVDVVGTGLSRHHYRRHGPLDPEGPGQNAPGSGVDAAR